MKAAHSNVIDLPTNSAINRAGRLLSQEMIGEVDLTTALDVLSRWRLLHNYPINTFQATLRYRLAAIDSGTLFGQRLKRAPSIIAKLKRLNGMKLARMQDIAGVRGVVSKLKYVRDAQAQYEEVGRIEHELIGVDDYIASPKPDGYRSLHMVFKYKNISKPSFDGMHVELQLRTKLQHAWATAVETMGTFVGQALKARQGETHWLRFFELTSSAFAHIEGSALIPAWSGLTFEETCLAVRQAEIQLGVIDKLEGFSIAVGGISDSKSFSRKYFYHVVVLDSIVRKVSILPFAEREFEQAAAEYDAIERRVLSGAPFEVFLVSAGPVKSLRKAYPNFFLDTGLFIREVRKLMAVGEAIRKGGNRRKLVLPKGQGYFDY